MIFVVKVEPSQSDFAYGLKAWRGAFQVMPREHRHHDLEANYLQSGSVTYLISGRRVRFEPGRWYLFWAGQPHHVLEHAPQTEAAWLVLPVGWVGRLGLETEHLPGLLRGQVFGTRWRGRAEVHRVAQWIWMLRQDEARWRETAAMQIESAWRELVLRGLAPLGEQEVGAPRAPLPLEAPSSEPVQGARDAVTRMAEVLSTQYLDPGLRVEEVAAAVSLSPAHAMRLFKKQLGLTVGDYLARQRVAHAQRLLITTDQGVHAVALNSGFGSVGRFHDAFKRQTGQTPARFRRGQRA